jgi:hypothetical protein
VHVIPEVLRCQTRRAGVPHFIPLYPLCSLFPTMLFLITLLLAPPLYAESYYSWYRNCSTYYTCYSCDYYHSCKSISDPSLYDAYSEPAESYNGFSTNASPSQPSEFKLNPMTWLWRSKFKVIPNPDSPDVLVVYIGKNPKADLRLLGAL